MPININPVIDPSTYEKVGRIVITSLAHGAEVSFFPYDFEFDDNFKPEWNSHDAFGRMDPVMIYKKTTRDMTISFNVVSNNKEQAIEHFKSLQNLINFLYPQYSNGESVILPRTAAAATTQSQRAEAQMTGRILPSGMLIVNKSPLMKIKFDNILDNDKYIIAVSNFKHKLKFDSSSTFRDSQTLKIVPGEFSISLSFKVLHTSDFNYSDLSRLYKG